MEPILTYRGTVYPWQCDHVGHLNVMWYVGKFDEATWKLLAEFGLTGDYFRDHGRGMVALEQTLRYRRELLAGDTVTIRSRVLEVRGKAIRFEHLMAAGTESEPAATCELVGVHLDRASRQACPLPEEVRERALARLKA
jgi:acyl-CoA thioester hydrolase